ncbi:MAG: pyridoxal 5'-phosphate synthase glutaminase subunit PdxT [Aigarchaeota archaeon]|nr:pyridoxal 5'-phosphate synthase glutaminase subunit PdxT [Aigarchaeota archaeon]MCS7127186.1 pyridoxal 5'-phosphate synthase glutaminase subunit PdxT [Candidatus Calditenuaceae archaeon]MCX8203814.1 pyridoxal 5'-phosphate synthase glutaminase subunit PdxT [Nitrososphaeria archaeon]MDW8042641.1 pyridoxal 5'-phosphate synthase glutaminase subunit PdxT [Nitrososphaerota archaeon]
MAYQVKVGVTTFQGDVEEHLLALREAMRRLNVKGEVVTAKLPEEIEQLDAVVIPGGESTVMGRLAQRSRSLDVLRRRILEGLPVLGTCAGLIFLASRVYDRVVGETRQPILGVLDVTVERNSYGRQRDSFEVQITVPKLGREGFRAVFIRAPSIVEVGPEVEVLARYQERPVAVRQGPIYGTTFHPELSGDTAFHEALIEEAVRFSKR